jgi:hypothetical protein
MRLKAQSVDDVERRRQAIEQLLVEFRRRPARLWDEP